MTSASPIMAEVATGCSVKAWGSQTPVQEEMKQKSTKKYKIIKLQNMGPRGDTHWLKVYGDAQRF